MQIGNSHFLYFYSASKLTFRGIVLVSLAIFELHCLNLLPGIFILLQDIELSKEINESFKQSSQARTKLPSGIEMSVHVLTTGLVSLS